MNESIFIFHDIDKASIAAIEYVIFKHGDKIWFNAALNKVVTDILVKSHKEICTLPFTIIKKEKNIETTTTREIQLSHKGYHYIIHQIEKYNNIANLDNINTLMFKYCLIFSIILFLFLLVLLLYMYI